MKANINKSQAQASDAFLPVRACLADVVGQEYVDAVVRAGEWLTGTSRRAVADRVHDFYPAALQARFRELLPLIGTRVVEPLVGGTDGAGSAAFARASDLAAAPVAGLGYYRIGEDGRLYVTSKSEHYHTPLGHAFPGYGLVDTARELGIPNATHNNTRGHVTRTLERALVAAAGGRIDRVLNLETGSLAVEAALKMVLSRFYRLDGADAAPPYAGRVPVILVMGNDAGEPIGNYHGTTVLTQMLRGLWPDLGEAGFLPVAALRPNRDADIAAAFAKWERPPYKIAAFVHEIVMMNYGARRLAPAYLHAVYDHCAAHDVPTVADEIQSCAWYPRLLLAVEDGLQPDFIAVGKGFPGGQFAASRLVFNSAYDTLSQFGALVTNGQEELASLAYLVTMRWIAANGAAVAAAGDAIQDGFARLVQRFPAHLVGAEGHGHLAGLRFRDLERARAFVAGMRRHGFDISVQAYKDNCPPVALTKLPLIVDTCLIDTFVGVMHSSLEGV